MGAAECSERFALALLKAAAGDRIGRLESCGLLRLVTNSNPAAISTMRPEATTARKSLSIFGNAARVRAFPVRQ